MRVIYHPEAEKELLEAADYYSTKVSGLGAELLDEIEGAVEDIRIDPFRFPILEDDIRRSILKRFPYSIYYRVVGDAVRILVIKHHRRHPDYWKGRT